MTRLPACPDCGATPDEKRGILHSENCPNILATEAVSDADREWFAAHPNSYVYFRDPMPGDWGVASLGRFHPAPGKVRVQKVNDWVRLRRPPELLFILTPETLRTAPSLNENYLIRMMQGSGQLTAEQADGMLDLLRGAIDKLEGDQ